MIEAGRVDLESDFDPAKVAAALRLHRERGEDLGHALTAVLGIQLWDRMFRRGRLDLVRP